MKTAKELLLSSSYPLNRTTGETTMDDDKKPRLLLLEDEPIIARVVSRFLTSDGFEVDVAVNGQIARDKIDGGSKYDICIFDIKTPVISGIQLYEYLEKEHPDLTDSIIFATGDSLNEATKTFLERVKCPWISKPYTPVQIKNTVRQQLSQKKHRQKNNNTDLSGNLE
jgi:DNA-binding response OmpR family regulator